jgi:hypothetical protein
MGWARGCRRRGCELRAASIRCAGIVGAIIDHHLWAAKSHTVRYETYEIKIYKGPDPHTKSRMCCGMGRGVAVGPWVHTMCVCGMESARFSHRINKIIQQYKIIQKIKKG